jgi:hypothetical protein
MSIDFPKANQLAESLAKKRIDENELSKILTYMKINKNLNKTKLLLKRLIETKDFHRSGRSEQYFKEINNLLGTKHLSGKHEDDVQFIGWVARLIKYYKE